MLLVKFVDILRSHLKFIYLIWFASQIFKGWRNCLKFITDILVSSCLAEARQTNDVGIIVLTHFINDVNLW